MKYITTDHNNGLDIVKSNVELGALWSEIESALSAITDERIKKQIPLSSNKMSLSSAINDLIDEELTKRGWVSQSAIFQGEKYKDKRWRLDFSNFQPARARPMRNPPTPANSSATFPTGLVGSL